AGLIDSAAFIERFRRAVIGRRLARCQAAGVGASRRCARASPAATEARPSAASGETGSPRSQAPSAAAVTGLSARNAVTRVGVAWFSAHSQRKYPTPLPTPMKATAIQPTGVKPGRTAKKPSPAATGTRKTTEASIANALTGSVGYFWRYGRYRTLQRAPLRALAKTASSPIHASPTAPRWSDLSPSARPTPSIVSRTPPSFAGVSRSRPSAAAMSDVSSGNVAKISAARADGTERSP